MKKLLICGLLVTAGLTGCANQGAYMSNYSAANYQTNSVQQAQQVEYGKVVSVQQVAIQQRSNDLLTLGGAALGGLAGSNIGKGHGRTAGAIAGAIAGGMLANAAQENNRELGLEITVKLNSGKTISVTQAADYAFSKNQKVKVIYGNGSTRILPM